MAVIDASYNVAGSVYAYSIRDRVYCVNDFDKHQVVDAVTQSILDTGILGPSGAIGTPTASGSGAATEGTHLVRYRYMDDTTGYVSNPSDAIEVEATGTDTTFTFGIAPSGDDIDRSTDPRVTHVILEVTLVDGTEYYVAGKVLQTASSVVYSLSDTALAQQVSVSANWGGVDDDDSFRHNPPPLSTFGFEHRGIHFVGGSEDRTLTVTATDADETVSGTGFSDEWAGKLFVIDDEQVAILIESVTSSTELELAAPYSGTTGSKTARIASNFPNRIYWSKPQYLEAFDTTTRARDVLLARGDVLRMGVSYAGDAFFFGRSSASRLLFTSDPGAAEGQEFPLPGNRGCYGPRCVIEVEGRLFIWDRQGVWTLEGNRPTPLSGAVDDLMEAWIDDTYLNRMHVAFEPVARQVLFFFVNQFDPDSVTETNWAFAFGVDDGRWQLYRYRKPFTATALSRRPDGWVRLLASDDSGNLDFLGAEDQYDGSSDSTPAILTINGIDTTSGYVLTVEETLPASPALVGESVYDAVGGASYEITAHTTSTVTLGSTPSPVLTIGDEVYIGAIQWQYRTKWIPAPGDTKSRPAYLLLRLHPENETNQLLVTFYGDYSRTALTYTRYDQSTFPDGVTVLDDASVVKVDLDAGSGDGYVPVPVPSGWRRVLQVELAGTRPDGAVRLLSMSLSPSREAVTRE